MLLRCRKTTRVPFVPDAAQQRNGDASEKIGHAERRRCAAQVIVEARGLERLREDKSGIDQLRHVSRVCGG